MFTRILSLSLCLGLTITVVPAEGFTVEPGYQATELYSSAGTSTTIGGLDYYNGKLYFGQYTEIKSLDLSDNTNTVVGTVPANAGNSFVIVKPDDAVVYTSYGTSYSAPYPYKTGYLDSAGDFQNQLDMDGVYDAAVNSDGDLFIVANPDVDDDDVADGSRIYKYDWSNGSTTEVANIGGHSGGLAFDADDNLYYSAYNSGGVIRFDAAEVAVGGLDVGDATVVLTLNSPGFLAFDDMGDLFATNYDTSWNLHLNLYDLDTETKIADVASGGGKLVWAGDTLYTIDTDWGTYSSTIQAITAIPEPGTLALLAALALGSAAMVVRRRS